MSGVSSADQTPRVEHDRDGSDVGLTPNAVRVLQARYLKKDEQGQCVEEPQDMFRRVAKAAADAELRYNSGQGNRGEWENRFYELMADCRFLPNSPTLMNAGREMGMLSACFVLPVGDSVDEIFDSIKYTALIQKAGGGTGFAFDRLRPTGDYIRSSGGTTSGPISFWRAFSEATNAIQQGAFRRGANMGMMNIHHPDILKFLHAKQDLTQFTNYNISVKVTDAWMRAFQEDANASHVVVNPRNGRRYVIPRDASVEEYTIQSLIPVEAADPEERYYTMGDIWDIIIQNAWRTGEPGVVFIDRINEYNPTPHVGRIEATNPCGEQPLLDFEACNLGSVNLAKFIRNPGTPDAEVDWDVLGETIDESVRFLDNIIDANNYPLPQIEHISKANRKIGLGVMGFADALYMLGVAYDSEAGTEWGGRFMEFLNQRAHAASEGLAKGRGCFPNWPSSTWDTVHERPMRNACCTTVAPTGTISIIAGCSCGIEPLFALVFKRNVLKEEDDSGTPMIEINPIFERAAREANILSEGMMDRIAREGTLARIEGLPAELRRVFVTAHDISPEWHVRMQAAFQQHCDASISKTINFPEDAPPEAVGDIYRMSYELGCKGATVYRDGCRAEQPMAIDQADDVSAEPTETASAPREPVEVLEVSSGLRLRQMTPFGNMHVHITVDLESGRELEVFAQLGKGGDLSNSDLEAICRMVSLWLRSGGRLHHVIQQLQGIGSSLQVRTKEGTIMSLADGLAQALIKYTRAKTRFGLTDLLLGNFSADELGPTLRGEAPAPGRNGGNGNGNGNGKKGNGSGKRLVERSTSRPSGAPPRPKVTQEEQFKVVCPDCGAPLLFAEGCKQCVVCAYAAC